MNTEAIDATTNEPSRFTSLWCRIGSCGRPVDGNVGGPYCWAHRRTFQFSATLNDALNEFLSANGDSMKPTKANYDDVRQAGDHFAHGLSKLFGAAFGGATVLVKAAPITAKTLNGKSGGHSRWHVSFRWEELEDELNAYGADESDDSDDEDNEDEDGDDDD